MDITVLPPARLDEAVGLVAAAQADPATHVGYLGTDPDGIRGELQALEPDGLGGVLVALEDARLVGVLGVEHDTQPPRAWWYGPFVVAHAVDRVAVEDALYAEACRRLPPHVVEEECAPDARADVLAAFAERYGMRPEVGSAVLTTRTDADRPRPGTATEVGIRPPSPTERASAAALHDRLFPDTHSVGERALRDGPQRLPLVAVEDGRVVGYAAGELQPDGTGYLDYLGVEPGRRGGGIGRTLVLAVLDVLAERGVAELHLTVRADNPAARRLYEAIGFTEERVLVPYRRRERHG